MLDCRNDQPCDPAAWKYNSTTGVLEDPGCGSMVTYTYFISFIFLPFKLFQGLANLLRVNYIPYS